MYLLQTMMIAVEAIIAVCVYRTSYAGLASVAAADTSTDEKLVVRKYATAALALMTIYNAGVSQTIAESITSSFSGLLSVTVLTFLVYAVQRLPEIAERAILTVDKASEALAQPHELLASLKNDRPQFSFDGLRAYNPLGSLHTKSAIARIKTLKTWGSAAKAQLKTIKLLAQEKLARFEAQFISKSPFQPNRTSESLESGGGGSDNHGDSDSNTSSNPANSEELSSAEPNQSLSYEAQVSPPVSNDEPVVNQSYETVESDEDWQNASTTTVQFENRTWGWTVGTNDNGKEVVTYTSGEDEITIEYSTRAIIVNGRRMTLPANSDLDDAETLLENIESKNIRRAIRSALK